MSFLVLRFLKAANSSLSDWFVGLQLRREGTGIDPCAMTGGELYEVEVGPDADDIVNNRYESSPACSVLEHVINCDTVKGTYAVVYEL